MGEKEKRKEETIPIIHQTKGSCDLEHEMAAGSSLHAQLNLDNPIER